MSSNLKPKPTRPTKWQTDLLNSMHAKSPNPSDSQKKGIADETGLDEMWVKNWFKKQNAASTRRTPLPAVFKPSGKKSALRSSSEPIVISPPRPTIRPDDPSPFEWKEPTGTAGVFDHAPGYGAPGLRISSQLSSSTHFSAQIPQLHSPPFVLETPRIDLYSKAQYQVQADQEHSVLKPFPIFPVPPHSQQHSTKDGHAPQKSSVLSPSLGYIPTAFPISLFDDSPPKQHVIVTPRSTVNNRNQNASQDTNTQFVAPALQDPYSIRYPLTYSPDRESHFHNSISEAQSQPLLYAQPQSTVHFDYGYEIPPVSGLSYSASLQSQSTAVHTQSYNNTSTGAGLGFESTGSLLQRLPQQQQHIPIAYTARLSDLTAFALNLRASKVAVSSTSQSDGDTVSKNPQATDAIQSKVPDVDNMLIGDAGNEIQTRDNIPGAKQDDKENEFPAINCHQEPQAEEHSATSTDHNTTTTENADVVHNGEKKTDTAPRRVLRSASVHTK